MAEKTGAGKGKKAAEHKAEKAKKASAKSEAHKARKAAKSKPKEKTKHAYKVTRSPEAVKLSKAKTRLEKRKGKFRPQNFGRMARVPNRWRTPRGIDAGQRIGEKCKNPCPNSGYMTPQAVKGLHPTGYEPVRVFRLLDLEGLDPKRQAVIIASQVGKKNRAAIQKKAKEKGIQVLNYKE